MLSGKILNIYYRTIDYQKKLSFAHLSQYWSEDKWKKWQWEKIKLLINYAYEWVPYYRKLFDDNRILPIDIADWKSFESVPVLTKEMVREHEKELVTTNRWVLKNALPFSSSGSTGLPLRFYSTREQQTATQAFMDFQWTRIGYLPNSSRVIIRGLQSEKLISKMAPGIWNITVHGIEARNLNEIKTFFDTYKPDFLHAFPSSLWILTNLFIEQGISLDYTPKGMLIGSEKYPDNYRELFESFYKCKSYSWLGLAEGTILAGECEFTQNLHVIPGYSYVEFLPAKSGTESENVMKIVGTSLYNKAFPFIRYDCGDLAETIPAKCKCNRQYQLINHVVGRNSDYFVAKDNSRISLTAIYSAIHGDVFKGIKECQFVQKKPGIVDVIIVKNSSFSSNEEANLVSELNGRSANRLIFQPVYTSELIKTSTGKVKLLINEMNISNDK